jgi:hypothetical protein
MKQKERIDPGKVASLAQQIVKVLADAPSEARRRAVQAAFTVLGEESNELDSHRAGTVSTERVRQTTDLAAFFDRDENLKPSEHAYLCAAWHFAEYGNAAFSLDEVRTIASEVGVVIPDRLDMTLKQAGKAGKRLFTAAGRDAYRPTAAAGLFFKERWGVKPGKRAKKVSST